MLKEKSISGNGIAITLPAFLKWSSHLSKTDFLHQKTKDMMWQPFEYGNKKMFLPMAGKSIKPIIFRLMVFLAEM
jgi:hypothetical protein